MNRAKKLPRVRVADRRQRADDAARACCRERRAEAERPDLGRGGSAESLACGEHDNRVSSDGVCRDSRPCGALAADESQDRIIAARQSFRLNSSHLVISYAVFCLKEKKKR